MSVISVLENEAYSMEDPFHSLVPTATPIPFATNSADALDGSREGGGRDLH